MEYPAYSSYKPSNDKLGTDIPEHWSHKKLRFLLSESLTNGLFKRAEFWGKGRPIVNVTDVYVPDDVINLDLLDRVECDDLEFEKYSALEGDFFFVRSSLALDGIGKTAMVRNASEEAVFECHLVRGRPDKDVIDPIYLNYYLNSKYAKEYFKSVANLVTMATIDQMKLKDTRLIVPDYSEQQKIAAFLNYKTQQIDQLIEKKKSLIEKLEEKRIAVITQAVTKGLDKNAKLKPSGVDWLGDVPEHWEVRRLKFMASIKNGRDYKEVEVEDGGFPVYGSGGEFRHANAYLYEGESVLFGRKGTIDKPLYVNGRFWTVDTMFYSEILPNTEPKFLYYSSLTFRYQKLATQTALPSITQNDLENYLLCYPVLEEQGQIVLYLDKACEKIDKMLEVNDRAIDTLEEYRSAIITSAVTGKIDVREVEMPKEVA